MTDGLNGHDRPADLVLARVHLRLGSLALARAELETLAGRDELDGDGLLDLAEARWRTGDLDGAGEAAMAALDGDDGPLLALVVAAEAAAARGRPSEARRLAERALAASGGAIDPVFAGMPRAAVWPSDAAAPPPSPTTMFGPTPAPPTEAADVGDGEPAANASGAVEEDEATIALWDATILEAAATGDEADAGAEDVPTDRERAIAAAEPSWLAPDLPHGDEELERARVALADGDSDRAAVHLAFVLRLVPALAPIVVELVGDRPEPALAFVRGDAYRLVGREDDALRAFADAVRPPAELPAAPELAIDAVDTPDRPDHDPSEGDSA